VKRPLQSKLRAIEASMRANAPCAGFCFARLTASLGDKICYKHFVSQNPQLLQAILQTTYAIHCPADGIMRPLRPIATARMAQRILLRGELKLREAPLDLLQNGPIQKWNGIVSIRARHSRSDGSISRPLDGSLRINGGPIEIAGEPMRSGKVEQRCGA